MTNAAPGSIVNSCFNRCLARRKPSKHGSPGVRAGVTEMNQSAAIRAARRFYAAAAAGLVAGALMLGSASMSTARDQGAPGQWRALFPDLAADAFPDGLTGQAGAAVKAVLGQPKPWNVDLKRVGDIYLTGAVSNRPPEMTPNRDLAIDFYELAAGAGDPAAIVALAELHLADETIPAHCAIARDWIDAVEAVRAAKKSATGLNAASCGDLSTATEDPDRRLARLRARGDRGLTYSMTWLGDLYAEGEAFPRDPARAIEIWTVAAEAGNGLAIARLIAAYAEGALVPRDCAAAKAWFLSPQHRQAPSGPIHKLWLEEFNQVTPRGYCAEPDRRGNPPPHVPPPALPNETDAERERRRLTLATAPPASPDDAPAGALVPADPAAKARDAAAKEADRREERLRLRLAEQAAESKPQAAEAPRTRAEVDRELDVYERIRENDEAVERAQRRRDEQEAAAKAAAAARVVAVEVNRTPNLIIADTGTEIFTVSTVAPCTSASSPVIIDSLSAPNIHFRPLRNFVLDSEVAGTCRFAPGAKVHFLHRVGGIDVARGIATTAEMQSFEEGLNLTALGEAPPETPVATLLRTTSIGSDAFPARLVEIHAQEADPAERARLAWLLFQLGDGRDAAARERRNAYLAEALDAGNPAAMYAAAGEFVEMVYQATTPGDPGRNDALSKVKAAATGQSARMLLASAERGYAPALQTLRRAVENGFAVTPGGVAMSDTPSTPELERAFLARFNRAAKVVTVWFPDTTHCDESWCYVPPGNRYRFLVRDKACRAAGPGMARCTVVYSYVAGNTMVGDDFWGNAVNDMSAKGRGRLQLDLARTSDTWSITSLQPLN